MRIVYDVPPEETPLGLQYLAFTIIDEPAPAEELATVIEETL